MLNIAAIGIGAGLVSALLFGVVITGSPLAILLSVVAPLPIFIAALGWSHWTGLVAAVAGGAAMAVALNGTAGLAFALGWAIPAWWLGYLALLGRPLAAGAMEWYPLGRLLVWIVATASLITLLGVIALGDGSYDTFRANTRRMFEAMMGQGPQGGSGQPSSEAMGLFVGALPFFFAINFVLILTLNLWLAAKTVQMSGRLPRSWPDIPATTMPRVVLVGFGASVALAFAPGLAGAAGLILAGGFLAAFALQGLAFIHDTSRQRPGRGFLLGGLYVLLVFISQVTLPLLALLGCADVALPLRNRFRAGPPAPRPPTL